MEDGQWTTTVKFGLDSKPIYEKESFSYSPANGQLPAIQGLQLGKVVAISSDPGAEYRVQVKLGSTADGQTGVWARMANFYATASAGAFFYPETGDEVVVGFLENDPRFPVILGSLYNKGKTPPVTPADNNNYTKGLYTKGELKITFDDENKVITIITKGKNTITLSDQGQSIEMTDQSKNSIKMSASGIAITSASDLNLKATGSITLNGTGGVTISSPANISASGANISNSATAAFSATGTSSATLSSGGVMTIQGATVMIN
jgi:uncharacterized protein involved in type VI secretion and phage assembly